MTKKDKDAVRSAAIKARDELHAALLVMKAKPRSGTDLRDLHLLEEATNNLELVIF